MEKSENFLFKSIFELRQNSINFLFAKLREGLSRTEIQPSFILFDSSSTIKLKSGNKLFPNPLQALHAPSGLLKENLFDDNLEYSLLHLVQQNSFL